MGNKQLNSNKTLNNIEVKEGISDDQTRALIRIQLFIKRFLAFKKKRDLLTNLILELKQKIERGEVKEFQYESKKKLRERVGNLINDLIVRDDNSYLFESHFELICSLQNRFLLWTPEFPLKIESKIINYSRNIEINDKFTKIDEKEKNHYLYYIGQITTNLELTGFGSLVLPGNYVAKGIFIRGKIQSPAKLYYPEGLIYEGTFFI
jgi:hypothetical protein